VRLLVVGASGFIGRHLLGGLPDDGFEMTATYHQAGDFPSFVRTLNPHIRALQCDLLRPDNDFSQYDVAVYMAGNSNHAWAGANPGLDLTLNATALIRFLETFRGRLVLLSSGAVYYGNEGPVSPSTRLEPAFPYAISKLASEFYVQWAQADGRLRSHTIVRLYYAYGPGEESRRLICRALTRFGLEGVDTFSVTGDGTSYMAPLQVADVSRALRQVLLTDRSGIYDLTRDRPLTVLEIVGCAARVCGVNARVEHVPTDERPLRFYSSSAEFERGFDFVPQVSLEDGMKAYLEHLKRGPAR